MMGIESLTLTVNQEIRVRASLENTFAALLEQMGPENENPQGKMPMKLEAWPGGRWFRDLGDGNGHFWGHGAGDQASDAAGDHGTAVHVVCGGVEPAIPAHGRRRRDGDPVSSQSVWSDSGRAPARRGYGMEQLASADQSTGGRQEVNSRFLTGKDAGSK